MPGNTFGTLFKIITWGESHGDAVGVVIEGCPAGLALSTEEITEELALRRPGQSSHVSPRNEPDQPKILSGVFEGQTTGSPISILIPNEDVDSSKYVPIKEVLRPGHANFTYLKKYGIVDWRGGGRASARETVARVAAGAVAKQLLKTYGIDIAAHLCQVGPCQAKANDPISPDEIRSQRDSLFCIDRNCSKNMQHLIEKMQKDGDSIGGVVELCTTRLPIGLGEPVFDKLEAMLGHAILSIPACKGIEFGEGFHSASMKGSEHNDRFIKNENGEVVTETNHSGGLLGGLSNGMPLTLRAAFKPTSSIVKAQETLTQSGETVLFKLPEGARHDPCVAIRAVPVVEAMAALALADALLLNRSCKKNR